jgi:hypothetical protein
MNYITAACDLHRSSNIPSTSCRLAERHNTIYFISHPQFPNLAYWSLISNTRHLWWFIVMMNPQLDHTLLEGWTLYINQTDQRNLHNHNMKETLTMSAFITLLELITKCQTNTPSQISGTSCHHFYPLTSSAPLCKIFILIFFCSSQIVRKTLPQHWLALKRHS